MAQRNHHVKSPAEESSEVLAGSAGPMEALAT